ncbi:MAG: alanine racemase [Candidatus Dormibacteria bacterium]|jgi:D-serine deaminase-like pyridoxal phosphate-dependent protein
MDAERVLAAAEAVETPVAVVDVAAMEANLVAMRARATALGLGLRPHAKTHKSAFVARRQLAHGATGLTAATLTEAEVFASAGAGDLLIAFPPVGELRLRRLAALAERVGRLAVSLDSVEVAAALPDRVEVLWELDSGHHRVGTAPGTDTVTGVTALIAAVGAERFRGLLTFPGHAYAVADRAELGQIADAERRRMLETAARLRGAGIAVRELSVGSTPTASWTEAGPTEMRPGSYVYGDAQQVVLGAMTMEACALGVVATVVSTPAADRAVVDAGSKALAADARLSLLRGYGIVVGHHDLVLERMSEEHGMLVASGSRTGLRIGDRLLVIPAHCCTTVNLHPAVLMVEAERAWWDLVAARGWQAGSAEGPPGGHTAGAGI